MRAVDFSAAGAIRQAYDAVDWSAGPLGAPGSWDPVLRGALRTALSTRFPVALFWGADRALLYNAAFVELIGDKHPAALGAPGKAVFPEVWDTVGELMDGVMAGQGAVWFEDQPFVLERHGFAEECFFTFSYGPLLDDDGDIRGVLDIAVETTARVVDGRRLRVLGALDACLRTLQDPRELAETALPVLRAAERDLPAVDLLACGRSSAVLGTAAPRLRGRTLVPTTAGTVVWLPVDGQVEPAALGVLLNPQLPVDERYLGFLELAAAALSSAVAAAAVRAADERAAVATRSMSEALQRSLLTEPPQPDHLQIAVRYLPATRDAQVGGDWYDAFLTTDGTTALVIGDVSGHDQRAAAAMGQVRNLLRGIGHTSHATPADVLCSLDRAMRDLGVDVLATCVLAIVESSPESAPQGPRTLRWSNAGHPPPLVVDADGRAVLLHSEPDLLLGLDATTSRQDHTHALPDGSTVLLFTDGLFERRGAGLDEGMAWLVDVVQQHSGLELERLCDLLVDEVRGIGEDDVALLGMRLHPQDRPRPPDAGPERVPAQPAG